MSAREEAERRYPMHLVRTVMDYGGTTERPDNAPQRDAFEAGAAWAREQVAQEIEVEMRRHDHAQTGFSAVGDAYAHAARIARGKA